MKDNKQKIKSIVGVIEDSKQQAKNNKDQNNNKIVNNIKQNDNQDKNKNKDNHDVIKKQVVIAKASNIPDMNNDHSFITIEPGVNEGKSFHTEIETDRDPIDEEKENRMVKVKGSSKINLEISKKDIEPAFKLNMSDMKALNQNSSVDNLNKPAENNS